VTTFSDAIARVRSTRSSRRAGANAWLRPQMLFAYVVIAAWVLIVVAAPLIAPYDPFAVSGARLAPPDAIHLLGTDSLGRDVLSRTLFGARESLPVALGAILAAVAIGTLLGSAAGFFGGWVDTVVMRLADVTMAFPAILLAMAVAAALGPGLQNTLVAIVIVWWPIYARIMRGQVVSIKQREHVEASVAIGAGQWRTLLRHIVPHARTPIVVNSTMDLGQIIILVASLSFLGLGAAPPSPEWGAMITDGAKNFYQPWVAAAPGAAMVSIALAVNFLGDGLRDALDYRSRR
jgi:peptide/nickel transport system permease protein